jgi:hypothetical protein
LEKIEQLILQQARDHLAQVREGFVLSVRTAQLNEKSELRFLLERVLVDWNAFSRELGIDAGQEPTTEQNEPLIPVDDARQQLLSFGMAAIALGYLPKLPADQVTFPYSYNDPPTYCDIPTPNTPGAMLSRIEELEQMVWRLMGGDMQGLLHQRYGALRRTYGFFESSAHLARREMERFGMKRPAPQIALL